MRLAVCLALASLVGCAASTSRSGAPDTVACELASLPDGRSSDTVPVRVVPFRPQIIGGLEGLRRRIAGPADERRRGAIVGDVWVGARGEIEQAIVRRNTSAVPDAEVRRALAATQWLPGQTRYLTERSRCQIHLRLGRTGEGEQLDQIPS